jgi:hypothetical protein
MTVRNNSRKLVETVALSNAIAVWRGSKCVGVSPVHLIFVHEINCKLRYRINVAVEGLSEDRAEEAYFNAGRKIEKALEESGNFQVERIMSDPVVWDGREFYANRLVNLASLLKEDAA